MANLKDLNNRVSTLKNMQKVMRAMNMIASVKLRKLFRTQRSLSFFEKALKSISADIYNALKDSGLAFINGFEAVEKVHVVVFAADKGLCGSHNSSVQKQLDIFVNDKKKKNIAAEVSCIGLKAVNFCKRREYDIYTQTEINERGLDPDFMFKLASEISERFNNNAVQQVYIIADYFVSTLQQNASAEQIVPMFLPEDAPEIKQQFRPQLEPGPEKFAVFAQQQYIYYKLMSALANSRLSEQAARMTAMENATKNSEDMISHYEKLMNRARQAAITNDLIEIISGKEALKG